MLRFRIITSVVFYLFKKSCNFVVLKTEKNTPSPSESPSKGKPSGKGGRRPYSTGRRYRVEIINENTLSRVWSVNLRGKQVVMAGALVVAAIASLVAVIFMFTPLGLLLPGQLSGEERRGYTDAALRIDSLERVSAVQVAYTRNLINILDDSLPEVNEAELAAAATASPSVIDTLISAGESERRFVKQFEQDSRFNLSVLSPIAATGMIFESPSMTDTGAGPVMAVYRGTVVSVFYDPDGWSTAIVQHPNDFITVYDNLDEVYIDRGDKVVAGQRIGEATAARPLAFELWHGGTKLAPATYIPY